MKPAATLLVLLAAIAAGFGVRIAPCLRDPGFAFAFDGRYHERLTREVVEHGRLAPLDSLSEFPTGRVTARHLPPGLYVTGAVAHRVLRAMGSPDLRWNLAILGSLAGALVAVPAWIGARVLFADPRAAALAAVLAVFLPAHVLRTLGLTLRYDALGTLLATLHAALALGALRETRVRRRWAWVAGAALALVAALFVWRVSVIVLQLELAAAALVFVVRGPDRPARELWLAVAAAGTAGFSALAYLHAHRFLVSPLWLGVIGMAALQVAPGLGPERRPWRRALAVLAVIAIALALGRFDASADYAGLVAMLGARFGFARGANPDAALMLGVAELRGLGLRRFLFAPEVMSWLGLAFVLSPLGLAWLRPPGARGVRFDPAIVTFAILAAGLSVAALLFQRGIVLVCPVAAIAVAGWIVRAAFGAPEGDAAAAPGPATPRRAPRAATRAVARGTRAMAPARAVRVAVAAAVSVTAASAVASGIASASSRGSAPAPGLVAAIDYLGRHAGARDAVLCDWDTGYEVQSRVGRATVVDGLLESEVNRRRIGEFYRALMSPGSGPLEAMCLRDRVRWVLMPPSAAIGVIAAVDGDPVAAVIARGDAVPRGPLTDHLIVHLLENDPEGAGLRRVFTAGAYSVYRVGTPDARAIGAPLNP